MGKRTDQAKKAWTKIKPYAAKAGSTAKKAGTKGYELSKRIEFNSPEQMQKAGAAWGFETPQANRLVAERRKAPKVTSKKKAPTKNKKRTVAPTKQKIEKPKPKQSAYVKVGNRSDATKKYPVSYKKKNASKYNRQWFASEQGAVKFANIISKEYKTSVSYE